MNKTKIKSIHNTMSFRGRQPEESHGISTKRFFASHSSAQNDVLRHSDGAKRPKNRKICECSRKTWRFFVPLRFALNDGKCAAFTLAEVLITLTIIGIIAAITIPNLMQSYKKHQVEVGVKEAYSILSNAITMAKTEHGNIEEMMNSAVASATDGREATGFFAEHYLEPYLKYNKKCHWLLRNGCSMFIPYSRVIMLNGTTENTGYGNTNAWSQIQLNNGIYIGVIQLTSKQYVFAVDINGAKGPNRAAYDIFYFSLYSPVYWTEYKEMFIGGGLNSCTPKNNNTCECGTKGIDCAYFIQKNGWKIPDDYPVKKF